MVTNNDDDPSHYLSFRISSTFQKWNKLKHILTDKKIIISTRIKLLELLEACVRNRLLCSAQSWEFSVSELRKLETIWHGSLRKMITNDFKRKNVPQEYLKPKMKAKNSNTTIPEPDGLDWAYIFNNK